MPCSLKLLPALVLLAPLLQAQSPAPPASGPVATIKTDARLVVVDVVVMDKNHQPVHNLKPSDFTLLEANVPQTIKNFEEHVALSPDEAARLPPPPKLPAGFFTNYAPAPPGAMNVLLLDALNTPMKDQVFVRDQLLQYVKNAPRGVPIAIFGLNQQLVMLQGFTSDPEILKSVVENKTSASPSRKLDNPLTGDGKPDSVANALSAMGADDIAVLIGNLQQVEAVQTSVDTQQRTRQTLDAMNALAHYLSSFPGRKNLIWFSASFPLSILPNAGVNRPFDVIIDSADEFRETSRLLAASRVAVYPVDARGLMNSTAQSAANDGAQYASARGNIGQQNKTAAQNDDEHGTMQQMADTTGGRAFFNINGLAAAVASAVSEGSNYYVLSYSPSDPKGDGGFRKIQLKLQQQGLNLDYRRGYYTDKPRSADSDAGMFTPITPSTKTMDLAMVHGAPSPSEIVLKARVLPSSTASEPQLAPGNTPGPRARDLKGPYRRYIIDIAADPRDITLIPSSDGKFTGDMQVMTFVYDQAGLLIGTTAKNIHTNLPVDGYKQLFQHGLQFHQEVSVPIKGTYYLRVGLHDLTSNRVGAFEVPVAAVQNLPSAPPVPAPPK